MSTSKLIKIIGVSTRVLCIGTSAFLWYWTYKHIYKQIDQSCEYEFRNTDDFSDSYKVIRMKIPSYSKGAIIGKNGSTIRKIQEKTKTTIKFVNKSAKCTMGNENVNSNCEWSVDLTKDNDNQESFEILLIRGLTLRVMEAEKEIKAVIDAVPAYCVDQMFIDDRFVGKLIGKKGENIRRLKELYKVQIDVDKTNNPQREITIRGISANNSECKQDIIKMIDAEVLKESRFNAPSSSRSRIESKELISKSPVVPDKVKSNEPVTESSHDFRRNFVTYPGSLNENVDIYVCSVIDCGRFYAHIVNDYTEALESLIERMTEHFSGATFRHDSVFNCGDIVAGFYEPSQTWQRVKILEIKDQLFEILYLDYGDATAVKKEDLRTFDNGSIFLDLPFQALELKTYGIQPCEEKWSDEEITKFEILTKVGCLHKIKSILKKTDGVDFEVQLIDEETGFDIAQKMITDGIARSSI